MLFSCHQGTVARRTASVQSRTPAQLGIRGILLFVMTWFVWLALAVLVTAVAAITGIKPKGTRHVAHTRLMGMARFVLVAVLIIVAYVAYRARSGG